LKAANTAFNPEVNDAKQERNAIEKHAAFSRHDCAVEAQLIPGEGGFALPAMARLPSDRGLNNGKVSAEARFCGLV
jgi:hypothetical protein